MLTVTRKSTQQVQFPPSPMCVINRTSLHQKEVPVIHGHVVFIIRECMKVRLHLQKALWGP